MTDFFTSEKKCVVSISMTDSDCNNCYFNFPFHSKQDSMMKKIAIFSLALLCSGALVHTLMTSSLLQAVESETSSRTVQSEEPEEDMGEKIDPSSTSLSEGDYTFPDFYRGIYLNVVNARDKARLQKFIDMAKKSHVNAFVMDVQSYKYRECIVPAENVKMCIENGIHPIARIVVFPEGLSRWPVSKDEIEAKYRIAEGAAKNGFREIQFDYIRFNDSNRLRHLNLKARYSFIEGFLKGARKRLEKYDVRTAADVFGRIPLNRGDLIGQRMEGLDLAVDIICPMAYPSHYTWSKKLQHDPYYTVHWTSSEANKRTTKAEIVTYIQAFQMRLGPNRYDHYVREQIRAVHDAGIRGYLMWNARQEYDVPLQVMRKYYSSRSALNE